MSNFCDFCLRKNKCEQNVVWTRPLRYCVTVIGQRIYLKVRHVFARRAKPYVEYAKRIHSVLPVLQNRQRAENRGTN